MSHPNEIQLVLRTTEGRILPTSYYFKLLDENAFATPAHTEAAKEQATRQIHELAIAAVKAVTPTTTAQAEG